MRFVLFARFLRQNFLFSVSNTFLQYNFAVDQWKISLHLTSSLIGECWAEDLIQEWFYKKNMKQLLVGGIRGTVKRALLKKLGLYPHPTLLPKKFNNPKFWKGSLNLIKTMRYHPLHLCAAHFWTVSRQIIFRQFWQKDGIAKDPPPPIQCCARVKKCFW